jgi:hypothetical protein
MGYPLASTSANVEMYFLVYVVIVTVGVGLSVLVINLMPIGGNARLVALACTTSLFLTPTLVGPRGM